MDDGVAGVWGFSKAEQGYMIKRDKIHVISDSNALQGQHIEFLIDGISSQSIIEQMSAVRLNEVVFVKETRSAKSNELDTTLTDDDAPSPSLPALQRISGHLYW